MGSLRAATFVSGDGTPDGVGTTSSNSFWPTDSSAILFSFSSDDSAISRTRPRLCARCSCTDFIDKLEQLLGAIPVARLQEAGFPKDLFGLGGGVVTRELRAANTSLPALHSSTINVRSDPRLPFGGFKESGYGRELSHQGIKRNSSYRMIAGQLRRPCRVRVRYASRALKPAPRNLPERRVKPPQLRPQRRPPWLDSGRSAHRHV
jgi:hypothetical protein